MFLKIAIRFGDNDFSNTFHNVLKLLANSFDWTGKILNDKKKLLSIINRLSPIIYVTHQNTFEYNGLECSNGDDLGTNKHFLNTIDYLQITEDRLLINEEVDKHIEECSGWNNGETFVLEINKNHQDVLIPYIYSI